METLFDLLGALPDDDAESLRAAFRRAAKRVHPDLNPDDPNAGPNFRRIVHAHEILSNAEQRAAYDHLLEDTRIEQEMRAKQALAARVRQFAFGAVGFAGALAVLTSAYALLIVQIPANTLTSSTIALIRQPAAILTTRAAREEPSVDSAPLQESEQTDFVRRPQAATSLTENTPLKPLDASAERLSDELAALDQNYATQDAQTIGSGHDQRLFSYRTGLEIQATLKTRVEAALDGSSTIGYRGEQKKAPQPLRARNDRHPRQRFAWLLKNPLALNCINCLIFGH